MVINTDNVHLYLYLWLMIVVLNPWSGVDDLDLEYPHIFHMHDVQGARYVCVQDNIYTESRSHREWDPE